MGATEDIMKMAKENDTDEFYVYCNEDMLKYKHINVE